MNATPRKVRPMYGQEHPCANVWRINNFDDLQRELSKLVPKQESSDRIEDPNGVPHKQISVRLLSRKADVPLMVSHVCRSMFEKIEQFVQNRQGIVGTGTLYWRVPVEVEAMPFAIIVEYKEDGPDFDDTRDYACVKDHEWFVVAGYARLSYSAPRD